jgi:hypothetical protein
MIELSEHPRLAREAAQEVLRFSRSRPENLERDLTAQMNIFSQEDRGHSPIADLAFNLIVPKRLTNEILWLHEYPSLRMHASIQIYSL